MSDINLSGAGWRAGLGGTLLAIGGVAGAGAIAEGNLSQGIGSAIFAGIGSALIASDRKKGKGMYGSGATMTKIDQGIAKHLKKFLKVNPHHMSGSGLKLSGQGITNKHIKDLLHKHQNIKIHIKDILGPDWKSKKEKLKQALEHAHKQQEGQGIFKDIKKGVRKAGKSIKKVSKKVYSKAKVYRDKAFHELKRFADGKTSFKPSDLLSYSAAAIGAIGFASAVIPGVDLISVPLASASALGLKSAALALKTSGRGQVGGINMPGEYAYVGARNLVETLIRQAGPDLSKSKVGLAIGLTGVALTGAYALYKKLTKKGSGGTLAGGNIGQGSTLAGGRKYRRKRGLIIGSKRDVWDPNSPCKITAGGLTRDCLMLGKGNKVISKKRHELGKLLYQRNKHKLSPFKPMKKKS